MADRPKVGTKKSMEQLLAERELAIRLTHDLELALELALFKGARGAARLIVERTSTAVVKELIAALQAQKRG